MTYEEVKQVVHARVLRWEDFGGNIERMLMEDFAPTIDALAAVTAERDQAREALAADNKLGAFETGKIIGAAEVRKELDQARDARESAVRDGRLRLVAVQRELDQARQMLADAPHAIQPPGCDYEATKTADHPLPCSCWKAGL